MQSRSIYGELGWCYSLCWLVVSLLLRRIVTAILVETAVSLPSDTPWDEPSTASPEYKAYLTGELLQYDPWNNIPQDALGKRSSAQDHRGIS